jgi:spermidine synthase
MFKDSQDLVGSETPLLREENGELSLHFDFPTIQSRMLKSDPERLVLDYTRTMMGFLLLHPRPARIAMIGLGGGSLVKYCRRRLPGSEFTAVELSPAVIALRDEFGIPQDSAGLRIVCADGAQFVRDASEAFDVLLVDGFDSAGQPPQLCSAAFYDACHAALRPGGVLVVNLCTDDSAHGRYVGRIGAAFADRLVVVDADDGDNKIVFAAKGGRFPPTFNELAERLRALETAHPVELDKTAQKILAPQQPHRSRRQRRG